VTSSYSRDPARPIPPRMRQVIAAERAGETQRETADRLGVSLQTVKTIRKAARARLTAAV